MRDGDERRSGLDEDDARSDLADVLQFRPGVRASSTTPGEPGLRVLLGEILRDERTSQDRTLADVAREAAISLPYLSEVERGR